MDDDAGQSSSGRSKRKKSDKTGRLSALEKLRKLKGSKNKYEVSEIDNVYDEVDEKVYSKTVMDRQNDDWIDDDGGSGYVEDGREIFDDDLDDDSIQQAAKNKSLAGPRKKRKIETKNKGNIRNMLMSMSSKKKPDEKMDDDNILGDLMSELQSNQPPTPKRVESHVRNKFCVPAKAQAANTEKPKSSSFTAELIESTDESVFQEPIFESRKKETISVVIEKKTNGSVPEELADQQSTSQEIEFDDSQTQTQASSSDIEARSSHPSVAEITEFELDFETEESFYAQNFGAADLKVVKPDEIIPAKPVEKLSEELKCVGSYKDQKLNDLEAEFGDQVWAEDFEMQLTEAEVAAASNMALSSIPLTQTKDGINVFRFYWLDAFEDQWKQPGTVYLFGKVYTESTKSYVSCCLQIRNIPRRLYLLPREFIKGKTNDVGEPQANSLEDVYNEFNEWSSKHDATEFRSTNVTMSYAFDRENTPKECDYVEVRYSSSLPAMDSNYSGPSIEHVFGTSVNALELLLIERNIKGPCWLEVKDPFPMSSPASWCNVQVTCIKLENISVYPEDLPKLPIPPMVVATLNVRMALNAQHHQNEVVMIGILLQNNYQIDKPSPKPLFQQHYCLVTRPRDITWPSHSRDFLSKTTVVKCETEADLLEKCLDIIHKADPDMLLGYDCGFQFDVLMHRISTFKVQKWSRVGKLKRSIIPRYKGKLNMGQTFCGRPICDIQTSAKELNLKVRSYDLSSLCTAILKKRENEVKEIKPVDCPKFYRSAKDIEKLVQITMNEALYIITLMFELNVMPLAVQITCIAGNVLSRTLSGGRAERNEFLLLHAFYKKNYITPDKRYATKGKNQAGNAAASTRKKPAYAGGLVLDPKKGLYDKLILLMDFNSLYPSIIQEYNLCFTTVPGAACAEITDLAIPKEDLEPGIVPTEIRKLVQSRCEVKKLMKTPNLSPELKMQYNIRQMALKLTANSMYGCLGASHCRFYAKGLAALVTAKGREILQNTKTLVEKLNFEVIYGDTDSIMINTNMLNYDQAFVIAKKIKQEVNRMYKKVELDIDGVFRYLLLLQKKKYAAVLMSKTPSGAVVFETEYKGLDIVRRDWCQIACDTGKNILDQLLCDQSSEDRRKKIFEILENVSTNIREERAALSALVMTKQLSKNPKDYPEKKLPHVSIALRLNQQGGRMWKAGDTVPYIICEDGTTRSATERAYHIDEFKKSETLKIDVNYYIASQIFPVILRICDPIQDIDDVLLAKHLGMEDTYKSKRIIHEKADDVEVPMEIDDDRYRYCLPLKFKCRKENCLKDIEISEFHTNFPSGKLPSLAQCANPECDMPPWKYVKSIQNEIQLALRRFISDYYSDLQECEDPICTNKTRHVPLNIRGIYPRCRVCKEAHLHRIYSETQLYNQISFYLYLVDLTPNKNLQGATSYPPEMLSAYDTLKEFIEKQLRRNAYSIVDLTSLFFPPTNIEITLAEVDEGSDYEISDDDEETFNEDTGKLTMQ